MSSHSDLLLAWRRLLTNKVISAAAILSIAVGSGACIAAFRLVDALLLRPLPIAAPERLYALSHREFEPNSDASRHDNWQYPLFLDMRSAVARQAALIAISDAELVEIDIEGGQEFERGNVQYASGDMFEVFGLRPSAGRLFTRNDDVQAGGHPVAVISHDYWSRRFARGHDVIGRTFRITNNLTGTRVYQIVGVAPIGFTGTEPGKAVDFFLPSSMHWAMPYPTWSLFKTFAHLRRDVSAAVVRERIERVVQAFDESRGTRSTRLVEMSASPAGVSAMQKSYLPSLVVLGALALVVLLIACANVANLMAAQAMARSHEMAIRVSLGASRWQISRLILLEAILIGLAGPAGGWWLAEWSIPFVLSNVNPPDNPVRLSLAVDWRVLVFAAAMALAMPLLFGVPSALQSSLIRPFEAMKSGYHASSHGRWMGIAVALQVAFCCIALHTAALFVFSFDRLSGQATGFSSERIVVFDIVNPENQPSTTWDQVADRLRGTPGIEAVAYADWPLLDGRSFKSNAISMNGQPPLNAAVSFMNVSPGWLDTMKIPFIAGRDFGASDLSPGAAIINEAFAAQFSPDGNPLGQWFEGSSGWMRGQRFQIVGLVRNARYRDLRQSAPPVAYTPFRRTDSKGTMQGGSLIVRTSTPNPLDLAVAVRSEIPHIRPEFRVSKVRSQQGLIESQTIRERLLAMLARFFGVVALLLVGIGLYGFLNYLVIQRRREIGICMALGAQPKDLAIRVTARTFSMMAGGAVAGFALSALTARYIESLLYQVRPTDVPVIGIPALAILATAIFSALPAVVRALQLDPVALLRAE